MCDMFPVWKTPYADACWPADTLTCEGAGLWLSFPVVPLWAPVDRAREGHARLTS
jgi:hypothetical protein